MTDTDNTLEANRGDIMREHRPQSLDVDWNMLLARGQDAQRTPGRKSRMALSRFAKLLDVLRVVVVRTAHDDRRA